MMFDDLLARVIAYAHEIRAAMEKQGRERLRSYPLVYSDEDPGPPPPQQAELEKLLAAQPMERLCALHALERVGRRIMFKAEDLPTLHEEARAELEHAHDAPILLAASTMLGIHIEDAMEKLAEIGLSPVQVFPPVALAG